METISGHIYDYPEYYDLVFSTDWKEEYHFLFDCFAQHAQVPLRKIFEPGCGTGRVIWRLAADGHDVSGLDLNPKAVAYCNKRLKSKGLPETAFVGDMTDFTLPQPVDLSFNLINTFRHLLTEEQANAHLRCMADCLSPGGLYLLGLHLLPTGCDPMGHEAWTAKRATLTVESDLTTTELDPVNRIERFRMTFDVTTPRRKFRIIEPITFRTYTADQILEFANSEPRFELVETYDFNYDIAEPVVVGETTEDVVLVFRRK